MKRIIGLGEMVISNDQDDILKTYSLSSCVGLTVYSKTKKAAGMAHIVLPSSLKNIGEYDKPAYYATEGVPLLINRLCTNYGCHKRELEIKLYGGSNFKGQKDVFKVGQKNLQQIKALLENLNVTYHLIDTGGYYIRTIEMKVSTGEISVIRQKT